jgi:hypothetical protein
VHDDSKWRNCHFERSEKSIQVGCEKISSRRLLEMTSGAQDLFWNRWILDPDLGS